MSAGSTQPVVPVVPVQPTLPVPQQVQIIPAVPNPATRVESVFAKKDWIQVGQLAVLLLLGAMVWTQKISFSQFEKYLPLLGIVEAQQVQNPGQPIVIPPVVNPSNPVVPVKHVTSLTVHDVKKIVAENNAEQMKAFAKLLDDKLKEFEE